MLKSNLCEKYSNSLNAVHYKDMSSNYIDNYINEPITISNADTSSSSDWTIDTILAKKYNNWQKSNVSPYRTNIDWIYDDSTSVTPYISNQTIYVDPKEEKIKQMGMGD
jgi:hypothetical protein